MRLALISLEPWDQIWRRNQHLAHQLVAQGLVQNILFVEPAVRGAGGWRERRLGESIRVLTPSQQVPNRLGGLAILGKTLRRRLRAEVDVLWINDPTLGVHCLLPDTPAVYDVTDDWREFGPARIRRRVTRAEDALSTRAETVVCSRTLRERWEERYDLRPQIIHNGVDLDVWHRSRARHLDGPGPHVGYIGTLHQERLDIELLLKCAEALPGGTVHLVGPDALDGTSRLLLQAHPRVRLHGPVAATEVPSWCTAMQVLLCPHLLSSFTLSLDAIKSYEYLTSGRPVLATPTSGFQDLASDRLTLATGRTFVSELVRLTGESQSAQLDTTSEEWSWAGRAADFAQVLGRVRSGRQRGSAT